MASAKQPTPKLTYKRLREVLSYDSLTGIFRWRIRKRRAEAGSVAGVINRHGYRVITVDQEPLRAARLAWFYVHRQWPDYEIDHRDLVRDHDWIDNLRLADQTQNNANRRAYRNNVSGLKGAHPQGNRWRADIRVNGRGIYLGMYDTPEEAHAAYLAKAKEVFGDFAR